MVRWLSIMAPRKLAEYDAKGKLLSEKLLKVVARAINGVDAQ
jgi:hypothetical protein